MNSAVSIKHASKQFGGQPVINDVSFDVRAGEVVSLIGPSGCGKSTLLRLLAGLEGDHSGQLSIDGAPVTGANTGVGLMFQEPRLMPWLTVADNVAFGLRGQHARDTEAITALLDQVQMHDAAGMLPKQLSGGMAQRAALARALATKPTLLLLDEPFSAVDAITRIHLQDLLLDTWQRTQLTMLLVTHDLDEALTLSDRVIVLSDRPASITAIIDVALPRPRNRGDLALLKLRASLMKSLHLARATPPAAGSGGTPFGV
jgi:sulfonate transport system ATP-binding protein